MDWAVPEECTNLWFDGWVMLKSGIGQDAAKKQAAEAFINFLSRPDNAVRNMYYIGYTSAIAGGDSDVIFDYLDWTYGAEEDEEDTIEYPVTTVMRTMSSPHRLSRRTASFLPSIPVRKRSAGVRSCCILTTRVIRTSIRCGSM